MKPRVDSLLELGYDRIGRSTAVNQDTTLSSVERHTAAQTLALQAIAYAVLAIAVAVIKIMRSMN